MANNCNNYVHFSGDPKMLSELADNLRKYDLVNYFTEFGDMVLGIDSVGQTLESIKKRYPRDPIYMYGTKWWNFEVEYNSGDSDLSVQGDSAWSPPTPLISLICKSYRLEGSIEYEEGGMDFAGIISFDENGDETKNEQMSATEYTYRDDIDYWLHDRSMMLDGEDDITFEGLKEDYPYAEDEYIEELIKMLK